jgi:hypothetical protein
MFPNRKVTQMTRLTGKTPLVLMVVVLVGAIATVVAAGGAFSAGGPSGPLTQVSNRGSSFDIAAAVKQHMGLDGYGAINLIANTNGERYLRFSRTNGNDCYGSGSVTGTLPVGVIKCDNGPSPFPSSSVPILDLSVVQVNADNSSSYVRVSGVAADGVSRIGVLNAAGQIVQTIPVTQNVYDSTDIAAGTVGALVALDSTGAVVAREPSQP